MKKAFLISLLLIPIFLLTASKVKAAPSNNPVFLTLEKANKLIAQALKPILSNLNSIALRVTNLESANTQLTTRVTQLESEVKNLKDSQMTFGQTIDRNSPQIGMITFQGNAKKMEFWFTPVQPVLSYIPGHLYHQYFQVSADNPSEWCGATPIVNRPPYNLFIPTGTMAYWKLFDLTDGGSMLCF